MPAAPGLSTLGYAPLALATLAGFGDQEAVVDGHRRFTFGGLHRRTLGMADVLWRHGVRPGQTIGVLAGNPAESLILQFASHLLGCRPAWVAPGAPPALRREFLRQARIDAFVYDAARLPELGAELADASATRAVFRFGRDPNGATGGRSDVELCGERPPALLPFDPADTAQPVGCLFQTGGSSGVPKVVHHGPGYFDALYRMSVHHGRKRTRPLRHLQHGGTWRAADQAAAYLTLLSGGTLHLREELEIEPFLGVVQAERINSAAMSPTELYALLDDPWLDSADLSSLVTLSVAGAPLAPARLAEAVARLGPIVRVAYGMSECPVITATAGVRVDPARFDLLASCGTPHGDVRVQVRDGSGAAAPAGAVGEIWVSGSLMMAEYFGAPELTARALVDGWLRTGDIGRLDGQGRLYIVDRARDIVSAGTGAANVPARLAQNVLLARPDVRAAAVRRVPAGVMGEVVHAYVVAAQGASPTAEQLLGYLRAQLGPVWAPSAVHLVAALPGE
jgi:acyl-CoA synthetase (AMP-forming)/AMP-acid ligase II